jgi:type II secretory pathway pseudopilin PulG
MPGSVSKYSDASSGGSISGGSDSYMSDTEVGSKATEGSNEAEKDQLAQKETRDVFLLRVLVVIVLLLAAVAVSVVVFFITRDAEVDEFETQYTALADTVLRAFEDIVTQKMGAISSVGVAAIAHGVDHSERWPFLTLSSFQERSATARSLSGAIFISLNPVVTDPQRKDWEKFVVEEAGWIPAGFEYQKDLEVDGFEKQVERLGAGDTGATSWTDGSNSTDVRDEIFYVDEGRTWIDPGPGRYLPSKFSFKAYRYGPGTGSFEDLSPNNFCLP